jgi:hypothetical protein
MEKKWKKLVKTKKKEKEKVINKKIGRITKVE